MDINYVFANKKTTDMTDIFGGYSYPKMAKARKNFKKVALRSASRNLTQAFQGVNKRAAVKNVIRIGKLVGRKLKSAYSRWKTSRTKSGGYRMMGMEMSSHNDMTVHTMAAVYLKGKPFKGKTTSSLTHIEDYQSVNSVGQGYQSVDQLEQIANHSKLRGDTNADRSQANQSVFNIYKLETAGGRVNLNTSTYDTNPTQLRLFYKSVTAKYEFVSLVNIPMVIELLLCSPKFDTDYNPVECWNAACLADAQSYGTAAQGQTTFGTTTTTVGYPATNTYGNNPTNHRDFNAQWSIVGRKTFVLQPGDQRIYSHTIHINKVISKEQFEKRNSFFKAGLSVVPLVIGKGGAVGLEGTETYAQQAGHGSVKYGVICSYKHNLKGVAQSQYNAVIMEENLTVGQLLTKQAIVDDNDAPAEVKEA